jgi:hypothetical protein
MAVVLLKKSKSIHLKEESRIWKGLLPRLFTHSLPYQNFMESILCNKNHNFLCKRAKMRKYSKTHFEKHIKCQHKR